MYEIANRLVAQRQEVAIVTDSPPTNIRRETRVRDVPTYILPKTRLLPVMSRRISPLEVQGLTDEFSPDVIYWDGGALVGNYIRKVKRIFKPIAVHISTNLYTIKDLHFPQEYHSLNRTFLIYAFTISSPLARPLVRLLNQRSVSLITVPNKSIEEKLVKIGVFEDKIKVLPTPFDKDRLYLSKSMVGSAQIREKVGLSINDFVVAYFGPPQPYRGTDTVLYAVARLKQKLPQIKLVMLLRPGGDSQDIYEKFLRKIVSTRKLDKNVIFINRRLRREDLIEMIKSFDTVALPFKFLLNEPPITALESMACGKPLITTRVSGLPELIGDDRGFLVEPRNESELAQTIYFIAKNPEEGCERGKKAREYVSMLPKWSDYAKHILRLFEGLID